ncbi:MAG: HlyD family efflux transporter periplasmic adaptor subunit [Syntrophobacter sp.]
MIRPIKNRGAITRGILVFAILLSGCGSPETNLLQGYVEGEFVYVASPLSGALESLHVERGVNVKPGDPLFELENVSEKAARDESERRLIQARANLEDLKKGKRPSEIDSMEAQLKQVRAALDLSGKELARQERLIVSNAVAQQDLDRTRSTHDQNRQKLAQIEADLRTARLGSRSDQIEAAEANVLAQEATLAMSEWNLSQKRKAAPKGGLIFDTLFREGEWVPSGRPVVVILPPENIKVRAFVPEPRIAALRMGDTVNVAVDGIQEPLIGKISFISPRAEYTPPVIYSKESRGKLVFMIEVVFNPEAAAKLHPGQPVDVRLGS